MIHLDPCDPPEVLVTKGEEEILLAIEYYRKKTNHKKAYKFSVYKTKEVVKVLNERFAYKCAYCESFYGATQPVDVEHYRPKAAVLEGRKKLLGYYWLAADWKNLLPSCTDCNRLRKHPRPDGTVVTSGKGNRFPISNPKQRATAPGEHTREKPLLLHPYEDDPAEHLQFTRDGMVIPRKGSRKGRVSIDVYGLFRPLLALARRERLTLILARMKAVRTIMKGLDDDPENATLKELLREGFEELDRFTKPDQPYSAMAAQIVADLMAEIA